MQMAVDRTVLDVRNEEKGELLTVRMSECVLGVGEGLGAPGTPFGAFHRVCRGGPSFTERTASDAM